MDSHYSTADIAALLDRYLLSLDDEKIDDSWARRLFTEDARVEFPMSGHEGIEGMAGYHRDALSAYARTQHLNSPSVVDEVDGEQARVRANIAVTHVHHPGTPADPIFAAGTLVTGRARRTQAGWRLAELAFRVLWTTGSPPHRGEV